MKIRTRIKKKIRKGFSDISSGLNLFFSPLNKLLSFLKKKFKKIKENLNKFSKSSEEKTFELISFIFYVVGFGFITNYMLWAIWGIGLNLYSLIGYGILVYYIREEFPSWFNRMKKK